MPDCDHCGTSFDDEADYLDHLDEEHAADLGRIEQRRVENRREERETTRSRYYHAALVAFVAVGVALVAGGGYLLFAGGSGGSNAAAGPGSPAGPEPHAYGSVHWHGTMEVVVDGHRIDFSRERYQLQDRYFHFERGNGERWHVHGQGVTLGYGLDTLGIHVDEATVTFRGTTYRESAPGTNVTITVNGDPVDPATYVLQDGDRVRVIVTQNESA